MFVAIIQGLFALILTCGIILGQMYIKPEFFRVIAFMMMYGGYEVAKAMFPVEVNYLGLGAEKTHEVLDPLIMPIIISIGILLLVGVLLGSI